MSGVFCNDHKNKSKWLEHLHHNHPRQYQQLLEEQKEKHRQENEQGLELEKILDNALKNVHSEIIYNFGTSDAYIIV